MVSRLLKSLLASRDGATAIEYGLIATLVVAAIIGSLSLVGDNLKIVFDTVAASFN